MKLIPKAKPVRIRISADGLEHSSLSTLREHFNFHEEILPLCTNGSILRWLQQQNEAKVLEKVKEAISREPNDKNDYILQLILSFFPDATNEGVQDYCGIVNYWEKKDYIGNILHLVSCIDDDNILNSILCACNENTKKCITKKLGDDSFNSGNMLEAGKYGNKQALKSLKEHMPDFAQSFSYDDVCSFNELIQRFKNHSTINESDYTAAIKNSASFLSLIQDIEKKTKYPNIDTLISFFVTENRICKKDWPDYLKEQITYVMFSTIVYLGKQNIDRIAKSLGVFYMGYSNEPSGTHSFAISKLLFRNDRRNYSDCLSVSSSAKRLLMAITIGNTESYCKALDFIAYEFLEGK